MNASQPGAGGPGPGKVTHTAVRSQPKCRQVFMVYQGMAGRMMMDPMQFMRDSGLVDRNLILFRDCNGSYYQKGVSPEVPTIPALLDWHQKFLTKLSHAPDRYCVGSSSGAYAAMLFGHLLKVKEVFAFAPPTNLTSLLEQDKIDCPDRTYVDLKPLLATSNGVTKYHVYYNESSSHDLEAAEHVRGLPGVELHPQAGTGHGVIIHLAKIGKLQTLLPPFAGI